MTQGCIFLPEMNISSHTLRIALYKNPGRHDTYGVYLVSLTKEDGNIDIREGCRRRRKKEVFWSFTIPPPDPPPPHPPPGYGPFTDMKIYPHFFLSKVRPQMSQTYFTFGPIPK